MTLYTTDVTELVLYTEDPQTDGPPTSHEVTHPGTLGGSIQGYIEMCRYTRLSATKGGTASCRKKTMAMNGGPVTCG